MQFLETQQASLEFCGFDISRFDIGGFEYLRKIRTCNTKEGLATAAAIALSLPTSSFLSALIKLPKNAVCQVCQLWK